jgi:hypothetical protein
LNLRRGENGKEKKVGGWRKRKKVNLELGVGFRKDPVIQKKKKNWARGEKNKRFNKNKIGEKVQRDEDKRGRTTGRWRKKRGKPVEVRVVGQGLDHTKNLGDRPQGVQGLRDEGDRAVAENDKDNVITDESTMLE